MWKQSFAVAAVALAFGIFGCSKDNTGSCERIVEACHEKDMGSGPEHECHEYAEGGATDDECAARESDCLSSCGAK